MSRVRNQYVVTAYIKDKRGRVLSVGRNSYVKTHPRMLRLGKRVGYRNQEKILLHAEVDAINKCSNLDRAHVIEIYVYSTRSKSYRGSKPCSVCTAALIEANIPFVTYHTSKGRGTVTVPITEFNLGDGYDRELP